MTVYGWIEAAQWFFFLYFIGINMGYVMLNLLSLRTVKRYVESHSLDDMPRGISGFEMPVSVLMPAYNEEATITSSVLSMMQLDYPEYEVIVINDGSRDGTMDALRREFDLEPFPEAYWQRLAVMPVRAIYRSKLYPMLRVIDKENGGKADALNAGINASRFPLFCGVDADSILERVSLRRVVEPFLEDPSTIASGGTVRIANGCTVDSGFLTRVDCPVISWRFCKSSSTCAPSSSVDWDGRHSMPSLSYRARSAFLGRMLWCVPVVIERIPWARTWNLLSGCIAYTALETYLIGLYLYRIRFAGLRLLKHCGC